MEDKRNFTQ